jgi:hypothetical protein
VLERWRLMATRSAVERSAKVGGTYVLEMRIRA